jgi:uncharacterized membrane protein
MSNANNHPEKPESSPTSQPTPRLHRRQARLTCTVCGKEKPAREMVRIDVIRPSLMERIRDDIPSLPVEGYICQSDLDQFRSRYVSEILRHERGELTQLEEEVVKSLADHDILAENIEAQFSEQRTFGEKLADQIASFGGSWKFILVFFFVLAVWMAFNIYAVRATIFDPYPFILLNLVLSCLAAIQAPIIMMSQNRQEARDRLRSENDYRINLKAELEIRHLHEKIDHMLTRQWERLAEIQQIQLEIMQDATNRRHP